MNVIFAVSVPSKAILWKGIDLKSHRPVHALPSAAQIVHCLLVVPARVEDLHTGNACGTVTIITVLMAHAQYENRRA